MDPHAASGPAFRCGALDRAGGSQCHARRLEATKRARPLIAVVGINEGTELTDYLTTLGILRRSGVADVVAVAPESGPVTLYPAALSVLPDATLAEFDAKYVEGADSVIVPAMSRDDAPTILSWLKTQAKNHAMILGVCVGAKVVAAAGLLDGKRATTHWYHLKTLRKAHPTLQYIPDRRFVVDGGVATTTGITASMPFCLTLIEAIAGRDKAQAVADELGVAHWDARHVSGAFQFTRAFAVTALRNRLALWNHEQLGIELTPGVDEVALALVADAWSRTYRSRAMTFTNTEGTVPTRDGLRLIAAGSVASSATEQRLPAIGP